MRPIRHMLGRATDNTTPQRPGALPPPPRPALTAHERAEREAARRRLEPKWAAFDALVDDFERSAARMRRQRT